MFMLILFFFTAEGLVKFLSPDELIDIEFEFAIPSFSKLQFLKGYGILTFPLIKNCEIQGKFTEHQVITVFGRELYDCDIYNIAYSAQKQGGGAFLAWADQSEFNDNWKDKILYNNENLDRIYYDPRSSLGIFCLLLLDSNSELSNYKNNDIQIWVEYSFNQIEKTTYPHLKYEMSSDFSVDNRFFNELSETYYYLVLKNNLDLTYAYKKIVMISSSGDDLADDDCLLAEIKDNIKYFYCLESNGVNKGYDRLMATTIIFNYYDSLPAMNHTEIFINLLNTIYEECYIDLDIICITDIFERNGEEPNLDPSILAQFGQENSLSFYSYSINHFYIYNSESMNIAFDNSYVAKYNYCNIYIDHCNNDTCLYKELDDHVCSLSCMLIIM